MEKRECVEFIYGGCAGNSNNFETKEDCEQKCVLENKQDADDNVLNTTVLPSSDLETVTEQVVVASSWKWALISAMNMSLFSCLISFIK